jgi:L-alanine-DL-glutamate epimerase-like enolase superfamily enzyme
LGVDPVYMLHLASCIPTQYQEFNARVHEPESWFTPTLEVKNGLLQVPREPGLGIRIDSKVLRRAKRL